MQSVKDAEKRVEHRRGVAERMGGWENTAYLYAAERDLYRARLVLLEAAQNRKAAA